jgi:hypothetical protein
VLSAPQAIDNRPSLSAIAYRIGSHGTFKESALAALSSSERPELRGLQVRSDDDFSIALLDGWSVVADILTFYQERFANEAYLRTATERLSLVALSRLIGYQLAPGVAASTQLAFTLDTTPGSPSEVMIDVGTKVQSVPGPGETAQTFETVEALDARAAWSALAAQTTEPRRPVKGDTGLALAGIATGLKVGDGILLIADDGTWAFRVAQTVTADATANVTRVTWDIELAQDYARAYAFDVRASLFGASAPEWKAMSSDFQSNYTGKPVPSPPLTEWPGFKVTTIGGPGLIQVDGEQPQIVARGYLVLRTRQDTALYTVTSAEPDAVSQFTLSSKTTAVQLASPDLTKFDGRVRQTRVYAASRQLTLAEQPLDGPLLPADRLPLATAQPDFPPGRTVIITAKPAGLQAQVPLTGKFADGKPRPIAQGEVLAAAALPVRKGFQLEYALTDSTGQPVTLSLPLFIFIRRPVVAWVPAPAFAAEVSELAVVTSVDTSDAAHTVLFLDRTLGNVYDRATVEIAGNVALATHGETVSELLGDGNAAVPFQSFTLKQSPVTWVSAPTAAGAASTVVLRVNDVQWTEVRALFGHGPRDRVFVAGRDDRDVTSVRFGDGRAGARPPSGSANVRATYRKGIGAAGNVAAGSITTLMTRPLGVRAVDNPLAATGGQDAQTVGGARDNAPVTVMTIDRAVSLLDYQNFARTFAGVAKALATWSWDGRERGVFLTVAGTGGAPIPAGSQTLINLIGALRAAGDPHVPLRVQSYRPAAFRLSLRVKVDAAHDPDLVLPAVESALRAAFSFDARGFGQMVALSSVYAVVQSVAGVTAARIVALYRDGDDAKLDPRLAAALPTPGAQAGTMLAAELLTLSSAPLDALTEMTEGGAA